MLHPNIAFVHLSNQIDVFPANCANVKLLHALQEVLLFNLRLHLCPNLVQRRVVTPVSIGRLRWERMLEHHHCKNRLDDQVIWLDQVSQISVLFEGRRGWLGGVFDELGKQLIDPDLISAQLLVLDLVSLAEPQGNGYQVPVNVLL